MYTLKINITYKVYIFCLGVGNIKQFNVSYFKYLMFLI